MNKHNEPESMEERLAILAPLGLTLESQYLKPGTREKYSTGGGKEPASMFCYRVTLSREDGRTFSTEYSMGLGHITHPKSTRPMDRPGITRKVWAGGSLDYIDSRSKRIPPDLIGVLYSLVSDAESSQCETFEAWAEELGYDTDSRKAEEIYNACKKIGRDLQRLLSSSELATVRLAVAGY